VSIFLIALFFVSGADAAAVVMATMATRGALEPPKIVTIVLGVLMGAIACAMLFVGGLGALQQAAVLGSVPFTFVIVGVAWCWIKALREEGTPPTVPPERVRTGSHAVRALDAVDEGEAPRRGGGATS
jgi:glycine betaine transporter